MVKYILSRKLCLYIERDNTLNSTLLSYLENINEIISKSQIPGDCPKAVSKVYEVCEDGVQVGYLHFI